MGDTVRAEPSDSMRIKGSGIDRQVRISPFLYEASRVPSQLRVPWEVPAPIAHLTILVRKPRGCEHCRATLIKYS